MTSRERMDAAMHPGGGNLPDGVPVMCQLSLGHYFLHSGLDPLDVWHDTPAFATALLELQRRYGFDGILVNLPGRDPQWRQQIWSVETSEGRRIVRWANGRRTVVFPDDNPRVMDAAGRACTVPFAGIDPERLFYVDPHDLTGLDYPSPAAFPPWYWDTVSLVRDAAPEVSVHAEVFSPFSQLMELVGCAAGMMALVDDPAKVHACLSRLTEGTLALIRGHVTAGADAVLISSAYAGRGLISRDHYHRFVLPYERSLIHAHKHEHPGVPVYTHTCGAIGDRLELMLETGTDGIDTLDPPPLGTVDLADARRRLGVKAFIKGNVDPVNTVLRGTPAMCYRDAWERMTIAAADGGYILSTACSVPPHAPPENIRALVSAAVDWKV